ncbi:MAG TPA: ABC transporter substrate-binding protein, partial [Streptosporangiaceae bacterium]|nr:ABC transporter substrate-binding protein [Streptosporangiaceae bacterium]
MESSPENNIIRDFNPFVSTVPAVGMGATGLVYEPLLTFDLANPAQAPYPMVATSYTWGPGGKSITFAIRQGVKWNDGQPFTPADVVFTFNMLKATAAVNLNGVKYDGVTASGNNVVLTFATPQFTNLQSIAGTAMVPKHIWASVSNPATFADASPVGTGPMKLGSFTPQGFTLIKNPSYWQASQVQVPKVFFPVYTSNTSALSALFSGQIDWTGNFIQGLKSNFVDKNPSQHIGWENPGATNVLIPNMTTWPTNQLAVRQAISAAIDRTAIGNQGEDGQEGPISSASGLTTPIFTPWAGSGSAATENLTADPATAASILTKAGYKKDSAGFYALNGKEVSLKIEDPAAYTDYAQDDQIIVSELKAAGINATPNLTSTPAIWTSDLSNGNFQLSMHWGNGGITPYNMYDNWLDHTLVQGSNTNGDFGRLNNPQVQTYLSTIAADQPGSAQQVTDFQPLLKYVAANLPVIPTVFSA